MTSVQAAPGGGARLRVNLSAATGGGPARGGACGRWGGGNFCGDDHRFGALGSTGSKLQIGVENGGSAEHRNSHCAHEHQVWEPHLVLGLVSFGCGGGSSERVAGWVKRVKRVCVFGKRGGA